MESLDERYRRDEGRVYLTGIQAIVRCVRDRALLDRRLGLLTGSYVTGYEGSPLGGLDLEFARAQTLLDGLDIVHVDAVNEELAATAVSGTQLLGQLGTPRTSEAARTPYEGVTGYFYGKSPGLDRASDAIRHANLMGTHPRGGAVAFIGDDPAGKSSTIPGVCEAALADLRVPTLYPADAREVLTFGQHAAYLSRHTGLWSAVKIVSSVADGARTMDVPVDLAGRDAPHTGASDRPDPLAGLTPTTHVPQPRMVGPMLLDLERSLVDIRLPRAWEYARAHRLDRVEGGRHDTIGIVSAGATALAVRDALTRLGLDEVARRRHGIRLLRLGLIWPLDPRIAREFAVGLREIVVVEEKRSFLADQLKAVLYGMPDAPLIVGKTDERGAQLISPVASLDTDAVADVLGHRLGQVHDIEPARAWAARTADRAPHGRNTTGNLLPLPARTPYFCSGCPHNTSTLAPEGVLLGGGIGCHTLVLMVDDARAGHYTGITQMGGEGAQWLGLRQFVEQDHFVQNIGDGTLTHSGSLAIRAAVADGANLTYKILYNHAVAMTGGQVPAGGFSLGRLVRLLQAESVTRVAITTDDVGRTRAQDLPRGVEVRPRQDIVRLQSELAALPGVTVLIHDQPCATELRRRRTRGTAPSPSTRVMIHERICEGCGDCARASNCLSVRPVSSPYGQKRRIHQSSCVVDTACVQGDCPSFLLVTPGTSGAATAPPIDAAALPSPAPERPSDTKDGPGPTEFSLRITGIGGTGVVTAAQIVATAAVIAGRGVRALHQTGLAQKGGAVVSDVRLTDADVPGQVPTGMADLYLAADALVGADPAYLRAASPERTLVVQNTAQVPTGQMVLDSSRVYPGTSVHDRLGAASAGRVALDAAAAADALFGDEQPALLLMLGVAHQHGWLPLPAGAIESAIALNGAARDVNIQAFRRGRQFVADPAAFAAAVDARRRSSADIGASVDGGAGGGGGGGAGAGAGVDAGSPPGLDALIDDRAADLADYQDVRYARRYLDLVAVVRRAEQAAVPEKHSLARAVATHAYQLMAYKDEYEVARLLLDAELAATVAAQFGPDATYRVLLHPPALRALGVGRKIAFGSRARPLWQALHAARRVRGTRFDAFGYTRVRRVERALIEEYRQAILALLPTLTPAGHAAAVEIAGLPGIVRGYEQVKLDNIALYRDALADQLTAYRERSRREPSRSDSPAAN
ncbi:MAG: indolepyruvate ferredoxin oxidoreductase family protein [Dermatophilaceae bacterium]